MKKNWQIILFFLCLVGLLSLLIIFRSFFFESILRPIGLIFWLGWRVIASVNQSFYWAMVIIISAFLVIQMLPRESLPAQDEQKDHPNKIMNTYLDWLSSLTHSTANLSALESLRQKLRERTISFISMADRVSMNEAEKTIQAKESPVSKESQSFLFSENEVPLDITGKLRLRIAFFLASVWKRKNPRVPKIIHQPVDQILSFMEEKAKTHHEH